MKLPFAAVVCTVSFAVSSLGGLAPNVAVAEEVKGFAPANSPLSVLLQQERRQLIALGANRAKRIAGVTKTKAVKVKTVSADAPKKSLSSFLRPKARPSNLRTTRGPKFVNSFKELKTIDYAKGNAEWACLTEALYFEARGESFKGIAAVAEVIVNRAKSRKFPSSICAVISQGVGGKPGCQFSYKCDGRAEVYREKKAYIRVAKMARAKLDDRLPHVTGGALYYHTTAVKPRWSRKFRRTARVGVHLFYKPS